MYKTLVEEGFFTDIGNRCRIVRNINSKMSIEINKSGIDETFNNKNFSNNSKNLKLLKLAIVRKLPQIIENGILIKDNVPSYHKNNSTLSFAYIEDKVYIGDSIATVKVTVRKSYQKNKFWVHHVYIENGNGSTSAGTSKSSITAYTTSIANNMIQQSKSYVNTENIEDVSDVKYSIDDSFNDWLDDEELFFISDIE